MVTTKHFQEMLVSSALSCKKAEEAAGSYDMEYAVRLLEGAAINARHAAAEIEDELFRLRYRNINPVNPYQ